MTFTHKAFLHIYEFNNNLEVENVYLLNNSIELEPRSIKLFDGKVYLLLDRELIVLSYPDNDYTSPHNERLSYKTKSLYHDFAINKRGVFLFLKQIGDSESQGLHLVASTDCDIEGTGATKIKDNPKRARILN